MKGFRTFILRGNVVDLAIAVVIGAAFGTVVSALVKDLLTPLIAAIGGKQDFSNMFFTLNNSKFLYGDFINAIIAFIILALVVYYLVVVPVNALMARYHSEPPPPAKTRPCPECLSDVPLAARRCAFCASPLPSA
ncbi:MAG: large conductance mechanosensitive channel protein MscL [Chloroflexota bacterium]